MNTPPAGAIFLPCDVAATRLLCDKDLTNAMPLSRVYAEPEKGVRMKTFLIEVEIIEKMDGGARVRLLTDLGNPTILVSDERLIAADWSPEPAAR